MIPQEMRRLKTEQYINEAEAKRRKVLEIQNKLFADDEKLSYEERESLSLDLDIAKQELEFFIWERDITGAKKGQRFGLELGDLLDEMGLGRNESGKPFVEDSEGLHKNHLILVNMGELDRLNSIGEHRLGDVGLGLAYDKIQQQFAGNIRRHLQDENLEAKIPQMFEVYRMNGNDFAVIVKDVDKEIVDKIVESLNGLIQIRADEKAESVPLTAHAITFDNSFELLKELTDFETADKEIDVENDQSSKDKKLLITLLRERMFALGEFAKIKTRLDRIVNVINSPDEINPNELYEKYLKKSLGLLFAETGRTEALDYAEFVTALQQRGAGVLGADYNQLQWDQVKFTVSRDEAIRNFQDSHEMTVRMEIDLQKKLIDELHERGAREGMIINVEDLSKMDSKSRKKDLTKEDLNKVDEFKKRLDALGQSRGELSAKKLEDELDLAKEAQAVDPENQVLRKKKELAELRLEVNKLKQDTLTGLKNRGMLFQEMNERLNKQEPLSVVSIDMAFLKYFDKEGGKETGDSAIKAAGRILDNIARKYEDFGTQAYRVGGDEFVVTVNSDDLETVHRIINDIRFSALNDVESIPPHSGARSRYKDEVLQFNFGLTSYGKNTDPEMADPDKLLDTADALVEGDKTINRFVLLFNREIMKKGEGADRGADLEVLYSYSYKAIFGLEGRRLIEELANEYKSKNVSLAEINRQMMEFIARKLKDKGKDKLKQQELEFILLRNDLVKEMQEMEIARLMEDLQKVEAESEGKEHVIVSLKQKLKEAQQDRDKIMHARKEFV